MRYNERKNKFIQSVKEIISNDGFIKSNIISMDDLMLIDGNWTGYFVACRKGVAHYYFASSTNLRITVTYGGCLEPKRPFNIKGFKFESEVKQ